MSETNITETNSNGNVKITSNALATIVGKATTTVYGVVGMASRREFHDGLNQILNRQDYSKGILVNQDKKKHLNINIYVVIQYGTKLSEVARGIQKDVKYELEAMLGISHVSINVVIQGVRVSDKNRKHSNK